VPFAWGFSSTLRESGVDQVLTNRRLTATMSHRQTIGCKRAGGYPVTLGHRAHAPIWSRYGVRGDHDYQISGVTLLPELRSRTTVSDTAVADLYLIKVEIMDPTTTGTSKNKRETYPAGKITAACNLLERFI
jgi:hypothetical protein